MFAGQIRAARGLLRWSQADLSERSGVSAPTIKRLEAMDGELTGHTTTLRALETALTDAGISFFGVGEASESGGPGVRLKAE